MTLVMEAAVREAQAVSSHRDSCAKKTKTRDDEEADEDSQGEDDDASFASAESANPEETFPPRRSRGVSVAKPKVVEWTHEASSSEDEATIRF